MNIVTFHKFTADALVSYQANTLFLATKTTNNPISLETYTTHIKSTTASDVLDLEFLVAQSLGFEFSVWHAHRALWAYGWTSRWVYSLNQAVWSPTSILEPSQYKRQIGLKPIEMPMKPRWAMFALRDSRTLNSSTRLLK